MRSQIFFFNKQTRSIMCLSWVSTFKVSQVMYIAEYIAVFFMYLYMPPAPPPLCLSPCLLCTYSIWTELWGFTEDHIWKRSHWCIRYRAAPCVWRCGIWKKTSLRVKKRRGWGGGGSRATKVRQHTVRQQSALRLPAAWCGEGDATCQRVRGLAEWLHITLSAPATSHLYCNANPWPVPDGAFPALWVHRNMIIYPKHF